MRDYEKALTLSRDIINCRLRKIVALAATPLETDEMVKNMSSEEKLLYRNISEIVNVFREDVLRLEGSR